MRAIAGLRLPKEHGAWAMLYVPFVLGVLVAGRLSWPLVFLFVAASASFLGRVPFLAWWRARARGKQDRALLVAFASTFGIAGASAVPLVFVWRLWAIVPLAMAGVSLLVIHASRASRRDDHSLTGELLAIGGLTMTGPASHVVATGAWSGTAALLWGLCFAYFASSVFYVKLRVSYLNPRRAADQRRLSRRCATYHLFLLVALVALGVSRSLPVFVAIAFGPILVRAFVAIARPAAALDLKRIGLAEIAYSIVFLTCVTVGLRV